MNIVSNKEPSENDFEYFKKKAMNAKDAAKILKCLDKERITLKGIEIAKIKKNGFALTEEEKDLHIDRGIERGIRSGNMKGQNATYLKTQLIHNIDELKFELQTLKDPVRREEIQLMLDKLQKRLEMVQRILK